MLMSVRKTPLSVPTTATTLSAPTTVLATMDTTWRGKEEAAVLVSEWAIAGLPLELVGG